MCKDTWVKWILGGVGLALLAAGAVRAVAVGGQSGIVIAIIVRAPLIISPFVIDRLESVSAGTTSVEVRFTPPPRRLRSWTPGRSGRFWRMVRLSSACWPWAAAVGAVPEFVAVVLLARHGTGPPRPTAGGEVQIAADPGYMPWR